VCQRPKSPFVIPINENDPYPFSPRIRTLRNILAKLRPEPVREPLPPYLLLAVAGPRHVPSGGAADLLSVPAVRASTGPAADDRVSRFPGPAPALVRAPHRPNALGQTSPSPSQRAQVSGVAKFTFRKINT
jgi:hypothetical protein